MIRMLDITRKDLLQLSRDFKTFMFLLLMPVIFTLLLGYTSGGFGGGDDQWVSDSLHDLLAASEVVRLEERGFRSAADLEKMVADGNLAAAVIVPDGYGRALLKGKRLRLVVIADTNTAAWTTIEAELLSLTSRLDGAVRTATIMEGLHVAGIPFEYAFEKTLSAWEQPPIAIHETTSLAVQKASRPGMALANTAPGMMLQFAIAGLLTAAQVIVSERKSRTLQRLLTTATRGVHILMGHYLAILFLISVQFLILILFGQLVLKVAYLRVPLATLLVAVSAALCISALGLLIGILAQTEEQAIIFSLVPMFVFAGLGGAWVPLEVTGPAFQAIGHLSPVAWGMDGFKNIAARGLGFESVLLPAAALIGYAALFFVLAVLRFRRIEM
jgi:ABC-2 type transport system permease protein